MSLLRESGLIGCLNGTGVTSENWRESMQWISVKERLPETEGEYLVSLNGSMMVCKWHGKDNPDRPRENTGWKLPYDFSHWMVLPNLPAEIVWIEFKDKMPNHNQYIKVKAEDLWHGEGIFQDGKFVYSWVKGACYGNPTHWMALTKLKKEE